MTDLKEQILTELDLIESNAAKLRTAAVGASRQTDLEVAILSRQVSDLREKNTKAAKIVDESISILAKLKGEQN